MIKLQHVTGSTDSDYQLLFFSAAQQDGNTGLVNAKIFTGTEGEDLTVRCSFPLSRSLKFFCKEKCENKNLLIETRDDGAQRGRYSVRYEEGSLSGGTLIVSITQLTNSDTGRYSCGLGRGSSLASSAQFEIIVADGEFLLKVTCLKVLFIYL